MDTMRTLLLLTLVGCSGPMTQSDAGARDDAAHVGDDAIVTLDAGTDGASSPDAWSTPDAFVGPDAWAACDLFTNVGCGTGTTCRHTPDGSGVAPDIGPVACTTDGPSLETRPCGAGCGHGLFCEASGACYRYCRGPSDTCPAVQGTAQRCTTNGAPDPYHCEPVF